MVGLGLSVGGVLVVGVGGSVRSNLLGVGFLVFLVFFFLVVVVGLVVDGMGVFFVWVV